MDFSEALVKYVIGETLKECVKEYDELNKFISKGIINKLTQVIEFPFERISYTKAIELVELNKQQILQTYSKDIEPKDIPVWGDDLGSYCEKFICDHIYKKPVLVYDYPKDLKSFYMKVNQDNKTCQAVDLLMPNLGELIGSSIREDSYEKLTNRMDEKSMDKSVLQWYVDLRKGGCAITGGAGLGFDRLVNFCCLMDGNIRDVVPFPVSYEECDY
jgi:asparaginyl-tRNA synthetase